jgi:subtilisin family serine protease
MRRRRQAVLAVALLGCLGGFAPATAADTERSTYIIQLQAEPVATGLARQGKLDPASPEAVDYRRRLDDLEVGVLQAAGVGDDLVGYRYRTTLAGFSARLTAQEAERLRQLPVVAAVTSDRIRSYGPRLQNEEEAPAEAAPATTASLVTAATPGVSPAATSPEEDLGRQPADYLGLPEGLWARLGGPDNAGEGIVVGVIDSGIYPEHPSFADTPIAPDGTRNYIGPAYGAPPPTWKGTCEEGENFPATSCNNKLIGARYFNDGFGDKVAEEDFLSPRDADGHGTGVASIAAGNYGVDPQFLGNDMGLGVISGIAPRARVAAYKAVWIVPAFEGSVGSDSDLAAAIDAAVADGVDVINMSVGVLIDTLGPFSNPSILMDPIALGFLRAFDAGVVAVNSAGNVPEMAIDHPAIAPWVIGAGASGLGTTFGTTVTVSAGPDGPTITAAGITATPGVPDLPVITGTAAAAPGADPALAERCARDTLDPALVQGKVVLCRPQGGAVLTSRNLWELGAAGGLFYTNTRTFRYNPEEYWLPTVILQPADGIAIRDLLASAPDATASFPDGTVTPTTGGDILLRFSSRGPAFIYPSILKPDLIAPGAGIIAAHTPDVPVGGFSVEPPGLFRPLFGTSFSSPVTAGVAALLLDLNPGLGPSEVMSALMTTANPAVLHDANGVPSAPTTPLEIGAGRIDPNRAADPGLVLSETTSRFETFLLTQVPTRDPAQPTVDASDLNRPSIAFDPLIGPRSTDRTFTSVDPQPAGWRASFTGLAGIEATVEPAQFSIDPGQSQTLRFTFAPAGPPTGGRYFDGAVVLTNEQDGRTVRLPVVLRPAPFEPPVRLNFGDTQPGGQAPFPVPTGYDGVLSVVGYGLAAPETIRNQTVGKDPNSGEDDALARPGPGITVFDVQVPAGAQALAAETGGPALADQLADIDLFLFYDDEGDGFDYDDLLEFSERDGSAESIIWTDLEPGAYRFAVRGFDADPIATFDLTTWLITDPAPDVLGDPPGPGLQVTGDPLTAVPGGLADLTVEWSGLDEPGVYLGLIRYDLPIAHPDRLPWETVVAITRHGDAAAS